MASEAIKRALKKNAETRLRMFNRIYQNFSDTYGDNYTAQHHTQDEFDRYYSDLGELRNLTQTLKSYYTDYGTDEQKASLGDIDSALASYDAVLEQKDSVMSYYAPYSTAEEYNTAYAENQAKIARNNELAVMDIDAAKAELDRLENNIRYSLNDSDAWKAEKDDLERDIEDATALQTISQSMSVMENDDFEALSVFNSDVNDTLYKYLNSNSEKEKKKLRKTEKHAYVSNNSGQISPEYEHLTDEEKQVYNYLVNTGNSEQASEFLTAMDQTLALREAEKMFNFGKDHGVLSSALSIMLNLGASVEQIGRIFDGKTNHMANVASALRSGVSSELGGLGSFLYNTGMSAADSVLAVFAPGQIGTVMLGLSAAGQTQNDIIQRGGTKEEALFGGLAAGIFEGFFEHFSISELQKMKPNEIVRNFKVFIGNVGKEMAVNASEEAATELANILTDEIVMGELSNFNVALEKYKAQGMSDSESGMKIAGDLVGQVLEAGASGALMGLGFASIGGGIGAVQRTVDGKRIVQADSEGRTKKRLISDAEELFTGDEYAEQRKLLDEVRQHLGKDTPAQQHRLGVLLEEVRKASAKEMMNKAQEDVSRTVKQAQKSASAVIIGGKNADVVYEHLPEIVEYSGMGGNQITVKGKDGESVSLSSLSLEDRELGEVYAYATTLGSVEAANSFLTYYEADMAGEGTTPTEFWTSWLGAQTLGQSLGASDAVLNEARAKYGGTLSGDAVTAAVIAGVNLRKGAQKQKTEAAEAYKKAWKEAGGEVKQGRFDDSKIQDELKDKATDSKETKREKKRRREFVEFARIFSDVFGVNVTFFASKQGRRKEDGLYDSRNNTIYLDLYAGIDDGTSNAEAIHDCLINTLSHETVHNMAVNAPSEYFALRDYVTEVLYRQKGYDLNQRIQEIIDGYAERKQTIDTETAIEEIVAAACEDMLGSSETIREFMEGFYEKNKKAAEKFSDTIKKILENLKEFFQKILDILGKKSDSVEAKAVRAAGTEIIAEIQKRFDAGMLALREGNMARNAASNRQSGTMSDVKYSLRYTTDNKAVAVIEKDIFKGKFDELSDSERIKIVKNAIKEFRPGVPVSGRFINISRKTAGHFTNSDYTDKLRNNDQKLYEDKLNLAQNIDDVIYASTNYINEDLKHLRDDNIIQFARGRVLLDIAGNQYEADVLVGYTSMREMILYDVQDLTSTTFQLKAKKAQSKLAGNESYTRKTIVPSNNSITQTDEKSSENSKKILEESETELSQLRMEPPEPSDLLALREGNMALNSLGKQKNTDADSGAVMNKERIQADMSESDRATILKQTQITPSTIEITSGFDMDFEDLEKNLKSAKKPMLEKLRELGFLKQYKTEAVDVEFEFTGGGLRKSVNSQRFEYGGSLADFAKVVMNLQTLLDHSALIEIHTDKAKGTPKENSRLLQTYVLLSAFREAETITPVQFEIKQYVDNNNRLYLAVALTKIETSVISDTAHQKGERTRLLPVSNINIPQLIEKINPQDKNFFKYIPDEFLNGEQLAAKEEALRTEKRKYEKDAEILYKLRRKTPSPAKLLEELFSNKEAFESYAEHQQSLVRYQGYLKKVQDAEKKIEEIDQNLNRLRSEHRQSGKGSRMDDLHKQRKAAEDTIAEYKRRMFSMEANALRSVVEKEIRKATIETQRRESEKYAQKSKERTENRSRREYIEKIEKRAKALGKAIEENSKDSHIPEIFQRTVADLISALDFSSRRSLAGGEATKKEALLVDAMQRMSEALNNRLRDENGKENASEALQAYLLACDMKDDLAKEFGDIYYNINQIARQYGSGDAIVLEKMSAVDLKALNSALFNISRMISNANKMIANHRYASIEALAETSIADLKEFERYHSKIEGVERFLRWSHATPFTAFRRLGNGAYSLFEEFMDGQDDLAFKAQEILDFTYKTYTAKESRKWSEQIHCFEINGGMLYMTTADIMSLYCLDKRQKSKDFTGGDHIGGGGIQLGNRKGKIEGETKTKEYANDPSGVAVSQALLSEILSKLTDRQREVADALQRFMSETCAEWGNEVSMKRFGTRQFLEQFYFPIQSSKETLYQDGTEQTKDQALFALLNASFTQKLNDQANNRIEIRNIFDVFADHAVMMAKYHAFAFPLLDMRKWLNYKVKTNIELGEEGKGFETAEIRALLKNAYGDAAEKYIKTFLEDINGANTETDRDMTLLKKMVSNYKIVAVGANLNVALIQPTAYLRASAEIDPRYMVKELKDTPQIGQAIQRAMQYSGMMVWKSLGYRDVNIAAPLQDKIKHTESRTRKIQEKTMILAEKADQITWGALWLACEEETKAKRNDLTDQTDEFYRAVALRFREVIYATQVVDSPLTKSQFMRSKSGWNSLFGAFMSENVQTYNTFLRVADEITDRKRRGLKITTNQFRKLGRVTAAFFMCELATALIRSFLDAFHDYDEDEEYWELYWQNFTETFVSGLVIPKIPVIKDLFETAKQALLGEYASSRMDMALFERAGRFGRNLYNMMFTDKDVSWSKIVKSFIDFFSTATGLPFSNLHREVESIYKAFVK